MMRRFIRQRLTFAARDERGITLVEGVVAALLLVIGALGVFQILDAGTRNTFRAEESQVVNNLLQAELEDIQRRDYATIALTEAPAKVNDPDDPRWRVSGTSYATARDGGELEPMVFNGGDVPGGGTVEGGEITPVSGEHSVGDVKVQIFRFITWTDDPDCAECGAGAMKRIIVAAKVVEAPVSFERAVQELQTTITDPTIKPDDNPAPPEDDPETTTAQFWLTDTTCDNAERIPPSSDHPAHNTRGICDSGHKTGNTRGAPDLMYTSAPSVEDNPSGTLYDYATDPGAEPAVGADQDVGLLMPKSTIDTCLLAPVLNTLDVKRLLDGVLSILQLPKLPGQLDGILDITALDSQRHLRVHTWVSPPIKGSGGLLLGRGTLELFTKTINGATHPGEICAWLSVRQSVTVPACLLNLLGICIPLGSTTIEVDLPVVNVGLLSGGECRTGLGLNLTNFQYSQNPWPRDWTKISVPMCFVSVNAAGAIIPTVLPPNSRIVLSLMVRRWGTGGEGLEFMYDQVGFESRLELETNKILSF